MNYTPEEIRMCADAKEAMDKGLPSEQFHPSYTKGKWEDFTGQFALHSGWLYRPKPAPKTRPWSKPDDVPVLCWIRKQGECSPGEDCAALITMFDEWGVFFVSASRNPEFWLWHELHDDCEYSTDRKTWHPCEVTE